MSVTNNWNSTLVGRPYRHGFEIRGASIITKWLSSPPQSAILIEVWPLGYSEKYLNRHEMTLYKSFCETLALHSLYSYYTEIIQ